MAALVPGFVVREVCGSTVEHDSESRPGDDVVLARPSPGRDACAVAIVPVAMEGVAKGGCGGADACGGVGGGQAEDGFEGSVVELGVQAVGIESDQLGQPVTGFAELLGHGRVVVLFQSLAQVAEGEFERRVPAGAVEHQAAFKGFAEADAGMVGVEDAEEAGQAGGHGSAEPPTGEANQHGR
ncbi:hypothetical protein [Streptomyces sp. NPDC005485]|uniref:hypothetical protein n=1 Tax=Streptomyces sp. NPDC005485 TaxID=3155591 RepID=UPI0033BFAF6F